MTTKTGNKLDKPKKKGTFAKGYDPRRNLRGVPASAIEARKKFRDIGAELLRIREKKNNGQEVEYDITRLDAMIRLRFGSKFPKDFETILKVMFPGLLKDEIDINAGGKTIAVRIVDDDE